MSTSRATAIGTTVLLALASLLPLAPRACGCLQKPAPSSSSSSSTRSSTRDHQQAEQRETVRDEHRGQVLTTSRTETRRPDGTIVVRELQRLEAPVDVAASTSSIRLTQDHAEARSATERRTVLGSAPALPRWSLSLELDNAGAVLRGRSSAQLRAGAGLRLVGPIWFELAAAPFRGEYGLGVAVDVAPTLAVNLRLDNALGLALRQEAPQLRAGVALELLGPLRLVATAAPLRGEYGGGFVARF